MKRILVVEDRPKHLQDARDFAGKLAGVETDFAVNLAEALAYLSEKKYDGVISDVFFPKDVGGSADSFENAVALNIKLVELGIHHVFNTAGNHHGLEYHGFIWKTPKATHNNDNYHFLTLGMVIESYQKDLDTDSKQWQAAFRYILMVLSFLELADKGTEVIKKNNIRGFPYGDYGGLTKSFNELAAKEPVVSEIFTRYNA